MTIFFARGLTRIARVTLALACLVANDDGAHAAQSLERGAAAGSPASMSWWVWVVAGATAGLAALVVGVLWHRRRGPKVETVTTSTSTPTQIVVPPPSVPPPSVPPPSRSYRERVLEKRVEIVDKYYALRDQVHDVQRPASERIEIQAKIARHQEVQLPRAVAEVPGATPPPPGWQDALSVCAQLANLGMFTEAREIMRLPDLLREFMPGEPSKLSASLTWAAGGVDGRPRDLSNGSRCLEAASVWCDIARSSRYDQVDLSSARDWFRRAIAWLPNDQDIPVLLRWTDFERSVRDAQSDLVIATNLKEAEARINGLEARGGLTTAQRVDVARVALQLAECEIDRQTGGFLTSSAGGVGVGGQAAEHLARASSALQGVPAYFDELSMSSPERESEVQRYASVHFRLQSAFVRLRLVEDNFDGAQQFIMKALGECSPRTGDVLRFDTDPMTGGRRVRLSAGWSRLMRASAQLPHEDVRSAEKLRRLWIEKLIEQARDRQASNERGRAMDGWIDAAWLLCRYWLRCDEPRLTEDVIDLDSLRRLTVQVLDAVAPKGREGSSALGSEHFLDADRDPWVVDELRRRISPAPPAQAGEERKAEPTPVPLASSIMWRLVAQPAHPHPIVEEIRLYEISPAGTGGALEGHSMSVELASGQFARRLGDFGYPMDHVYSEKVHANAWTDASREFDGSMLYGRLRSLGSITFDGLSGVGPRFTVVVRDQRGDERARHTFENLTVRGSAPPQRVSIDGLLESRWRLDLLLAMLAADAYPSLQDRANAHDLLDELAEFLEGELGTAKAMLLLPTLMPPATPSTLDAPAPLGVAAVPRGIESASFARRASGAFVDREALEQWWDRMIPPRGSPVIPRREEDVLHQLSQLPVDVREAIVRLVVRFSRCNPGRLKDKTVDAIMRLSVRASGGASPLGAPAVLPTVAATAQVAGWMEPVKTAPAQSGLTGTVSGVGDEFRRLKGRLNAEGISKVSWLFESDPIARAGVLEDMVRNVEIKRARTIQFDPARVARLDALLLDLRSFRDKHASSAVASQPT